MQPWSMNEVMMLGILVALIKIAQLATVIPGIGMYAVGVLVVLLAAITVDLRPARDLEAGRVGRRHAAARGRSPRVAQRGAGADRRRLPARRAARAGGARLLRDLRAAVAAGAAGAARATARAAAPTLACAPPLLDPVHVGARHRRGDLLHPGQRSAGARPRPRSGPPSPTPSWAA